MLIATAMSQNGRQLDSNLILRQTAMSQDAGIAGTKVYDFVRALPPRFTSVLNQVPWPRFSDQRAPFYDCRAALLLPFWLIYRLALAAIHRQAVISRPNGGAERLTVQHLAEVLDRGKWFEPTAR